MKNVQSELKNIFIIEIFTKKLSVWVSSIADKIANENLQFNREN